MWQTLSVLAIICDFKVKLVTFVSCIPLYKLNHSLIMIFQQVNLYRSLDTRC